MKVWKVWIVFVGALLALSVAGCGKTRTNSVVTGAPQHAHDGQVRVVMEGNEPPPGFREIALVQAQGLRGNADMAHVVEGLRAEARRLGCNIVVNVRVDQGVNQASGTGVCGVVAE
ncbi:MAG: hypothetical protein ACOC97_04865 [Myxococcota bacterium]